MIPRLTALVISSALVLASVTALAQNPNCAVTRTQLQTAIGVADAANTGGYELNLWLVMVDESGTVCHVLNGSGINGELAGNALWLGSRVIAAQKAFTANAFSLDRYAISTVNLFTPTPPENSLFELPESNPVGPAVAYKGPASQWRTKNDSLRGARMGGVNVFGGGLPIYQGAWRQLFFPSRWRQR